MKYHVEFEIDFKRNPYPGKLVVIEGIDGSGKTTQVSKVVKKLQEKTLNVLETKEPTDGPIGQLIRKVLSESIPVPATSIQYLIAADRAAHQEEIVRHLKDEKLVISDRYFWSAVAYGMADKNGIGENDKTVLLVAQSLLSMYNQFLVPDVTFFLDIPVDTALERLEKLDKTKELYERRDKLVKIEQGYRWLLKRFPEEFIVVNGEQSVEKVTQEILNKLPK